MIRSRFAVWYLPALLWGLVIITLTSLPKLMPPPLGFKAQDKVYHLLVYAIFGFLWMRACVQNRLEFRSRFTWRCGSYIALFAALDELHQLFIPGRYADIIDALADILGALLGIFAYNILLKISLNKNKSDGAKQTKKRELSKKANF